MEDAPRFLEADKIPVGDWEMKQPGSPTVTSFDPKWATRLWPLTSWLVFLVNLLVVISFVIDLWNSEYDNVKHITIIATICGSYAALKYIHEYISRHNDGRFS